MSKNSIVKKIFENVVVSAFLTLLAFVSAIISIYSYYEEQKAELRYEIMSNTNVLDFNTDLSKLEVIYDSTNLKRSGEDLRVYTIKIVNKGNKDILKTSFDENDPIGIEIRLGKIIERPEVIRSSSDYIKRNAKVVYYNRRKINFSQVILDSDEFFIIKILVLHKKGTNPELIAIGKVAGQKQIAVDNAVDSQNEDSFLAQTFYGGFAVQILRMFAYFIVVLIFIFFTVMIAAKAGDYMDKRRKNKLIADFKKLDTYIYTRIDDALFDSFRNNNGNYLKRVFDLVSNENRLNELYQRIQSKVANGEDLESILVSDSKITKYYIDEFDLIDAMVNDGLVFKQNEKLTINEPMKETLSRLMKYLEEKGEFKMSNRQTGVSSKTDSEVRQ